MILGADWQWEEQDGGRGNIGVVYKVKYNAVVYVRWLQIFSQGIRISTYIVLS